MLLSIIGRCNGHISRQEFLKTLNLSEGMVFIVDQAERAGYTNSGADL